MLRPLILTTDLKPGGLPWRMTRLAIALRERGHRPIVGCLGGRGELHGILEEQGVATFACGATRVSDVRAVAALRGVIRRENPDLIHASLFHANLAARWMGRLDCERPIITSTVTIEIERRWHRWGEMLTAGRSTLHAVNSNAVARHVIGDLGVDPGRVVVIPNGLDLRAIERTPPVNRGRFGLPDTSPLVVWAGRLDPVKQLETVVDAMGALHDAAGAFGVMLGDGPRREALAEYVRATGRTNCVRMLGWSEDVIGWLKAADLMLLCSRTEGSPNVVLEALACGCSVVASDIASCRELLDEGRRGLLAPVGDVAAFAAAGRRVLTNPEQQAIRRAGMDYVRDQHDMDRVVDRWIALYERAMGR